MARFSLKWLFVGVALLALVCGWMADRRRLMNELKHQKEYADSLEHKHRDALTSVAVQFATSFKSFGKLTASDGELNATSASVLALSGVPEVELEKATVLPEAAKVMAGTYDLHLDGDKHHYRGRWACAASIRFPRAASEDRVIGKDLTPGK